MMLYQITVVQMEKEGPVLTRICMGCEEPARETFAKLCHLMTGKGTVTFRLVSEPPQRDTEERERAMAFVENVLLDQSERRLQ